MKRFFFTILYTLFLISLTGCQTVSKKTCCPGKSTVGLRKRMGQEAASGGKSKAGQSEET